MSPPIRGREVVVPPDARLSAVMILLYALDGQWHIPFIRRTDDGRVHGGQVALPGGRCDATDPDFCFTALRETSEEIGVPPAAIEVLGSLTELYIPPSNSLVYPFVGLFAGRPVFRPEPREVAAVIEIPLLRFADPAVQGLHRVRVKGDWYIDAPGYTPATDVLIWGGTAMMIAELTTLLRPVLPLH
ncbi:MAG: CoA pyrophosphatase [Bacteroidia bacterium]